jgi:very-short-patch-repair endonuclease
MSAAEEAFLAAWNKAPLEGADLVREYRFHPLRRWRFDVAFPRAKLAVEIDGRGRHQTVTGVRSDCEKANTATLMGWRVLRFPATDKAKAAEWVELCKEVLCCKP